MNGRFLCYCEAVRPKQSVSSPSAPRDDSEGVVCNDTGNRGAILLIVLIVVLTISLLGATLITLFFNVLTSSQIELDRMRALYLAEAGIAQATNSLKGAAAAEEAGGGEGEEGFSTRPSGSLEEGLEESAGRMALGGGFFEVETDMSHSTITSVGISNEVRRTIQVKFNAF